MVLAAALDYYCYISLRKLPNFFDHVSKAVYSAIELVDDNNDFEHPSIRACLQYFSIKYGIELHHDSDIPAKTGIGSSSSFTVGLLSALAELAEKSMSPRDLSESAIHVEQNIIGEPVGVQDQIIATYGGIKKISLGSAGVMDVESLRITKSYSSFIEENILFGFTGDIRFSSNHSGRLVQQIESYSVDRLLGELVDISTLAINEFENECELSKLGRYFQDSWEIKKALSNSSIPDDFVRMHDDCIRMGAFGGKLMGAGGGGAFYFLAPKEIHGAIKQHLSNVKVWLPVKFADFGSTVIFKFTQVSCANQWISFFEVAT